MAEVDALSWAWRRACEGAGLAHDVATVTGPTVTVPRLAHVTLGPPTVLIVELLPGQLPADVRAAAARLAPHLGALALRISPVGHRHLRVELLTADPLAGEVAMPPPMRMGPVLLAGDEHGRRVEVDHPAELPHLVVQGQTRSGKSAWLYALLVQLARRPAVALAGVDPTGLLLRPLLSTRHAPRLAVGLGDPERIPAVLEALVAEMDERIAAIPWTDDRTLLGPDVPLVVIVLEEWPGVLLALDAVDPKGAGRRARAAVSRLLAESHKAGMRVVLVAQRADASVIGGAARANAAGRLSFRVDNGDAVRMLHPEADPALVDAHTCAPPGVALLSLPGRPLARVRGPWLGGYREYVAGVSDDQRPA